MAAKKWDDRKKAILKQVWPKYVCGDLTDSDMERAFQNCISTIKSHASKLGLIDEKPSIDLEYLRELGVTIEV